ncbi:hypothetical protein WDW86_13270 [Bdellovibrionota bacterium FG-2]
MTRCMKSLTRYQTAPLTLVFVAIALSWSLGALADWYGGHGGEPTFPEEEYQQSKDVEDVAALAALIPGKKT